MRRQYRLTKAMLLLHIRNRLALFWNVAFPVFLLVIFSTIFGSGQNDGPSYIAWLVPGMVVLNLMAFGLIRSSSHILEMRQSGVLRRLQATPTPTLALSSSYIVANMLIGLAQCAVLVGVAYLFYDVTVTVRGVVQALPMLIAGLLTFIALGQIISGVATQISAAVAVGQLVYYSQMFVSDLFIPIRQLPAWIQHLAPYLPAHAMVQVVRSAFSEQGWEITLGFNLLVIVSYGLIATLLSARFFRWAPTA